MRRSWHPSLRYGRRVWPEEFASFGAVIGGCVQDHHPVAGPTAELPSRCARNCNQRTRRAIVPADSTIFRRLECAAAPSGRVEHPYSTPVRTTFDVMSAPDVAAAPLSGPPPDEPRRPSRAMAEDIGDVPHRAVLLRLERQEHAWVADLRFGSQAAVHPHRTLVGVDLDHDLTGTEVGPLTLKDLERVALAPSWAGRTWPATPPSAACRALQAAPAPLSLVARVRSGRSFGRAYHRRR